ncbi:Adenylyl cyclase-associated protein 1 [Symbiodinium microadriaticum]|uniref:Adenylyl cyclase-associated protein 1 n=1 Tax=Symbiodinium microadriaticum TaxID=2951 RepID=A0A1Q9D5S6_SYMMI|nr:Adenylyl cyclase-associated protein 1 [Symbiodinium microadriaticum]
MRNQVTSDMKTKNQPKDGTGTVVAPKAAPAPGPSKGFNRRGPRGPPSKELQKDVNWMVENYDGERNLVMDDVTMQQLVCIINCRNTTVHIKNKVKSICIDGCEKVNVICQDVISAVELVNSDRCQMQAVGKVVAIAIDKCDGVNVFLSKESVGAEITASKSSEMNVTIPDPDGEAIRKSRR